VGGGIAARAAHRRHAARACRGAGAAPPGRGSRRLAPGAGAAAVQRRGGLGRRGAPGRARAARRRHARRGRRRAHPGRRRHAEAGRPPGGVAARWCGATGKTDNCQAGVFLGDASRRGATLLVRRPYVPKPWFTDAYAPRRHACRPPSTAPSGRKPTSPPSWSRGGTGAGSSRRPGRSATSGSGATRRASTASPPSASGSWPRCRAPPTSGRCGRADARRPRPRPRLAAATRLSWPFTPSGADPGTPKPKLPRITTAGVNGQDSGTCRAW